MILAVDVGNRALKAALIESGEVVSRWKGVPDRSEEDRTVLESESGSKTGLESLLNDARVEGVALSSVVPLWTGRIRDMLGRPGGPGLLEVTSGIELPFELLLEGPETVGPDRICAACGAVSGGVEEAVIIDAGTAVTVDMLSRDGFCGGSIFPGPNLLSSALASGTAALPEVGISGPAEDPPGKSTREALERGIFWGLAGAVDMLVTRTLERFEGRPAEVLLTGGHAGLLEGRLSVAADSRPDLVFHGLELLYRINSGPGR